MVEAVRRSIPALRLESLLTLLWAGELAYLAFPSDDLAGVLVPGLVLYVLLALAGSRWQTLALCGALSAASLGLCLAYDVWSAIFPGLRKALIFLAFMPTAMLVRSTADHRPEITAARELFTSLRQDERGGGLLFGCHVIGSVLSVGIFALLAPIAGPNAPEAERKHIVGVGLRGMCLAAMWSPFFVSVALASEHMPSVELWRMMPFGFALAMIGLAISYAMFDNSGGLAGLARSLRSLAPVLPSVAIAACVVAVVTGTTALSTLQALAVSVPPLCALALIAQGRASIGATCVSTYRGLGAVGGEIGILSLSVVLGVVFEAALGESGLAPALGDLTPAPLAVIAATIALMSLAGLLGVHPIVSATVLLVLFANLPHVVSDLALILAVLVGWSLAAMVSVSGISVVLSSALFQIPPEGLIRGQNLLFVVVFGTVSVFLLTLMNNTLWE